MRNLTYENLIYKIYLVRKFPDLRYYATYMLLVCEIAASVQNNDTDQADYLSDLIIRDYGTHYNNHNS